MNDLFSGDVSSEEEQKDPRNIVGYVGGDTSLGEVPKTVFDSLSSSEKEDGLLQSKIVGTIMPGRVGESLWILNMPEFSSDWEGG